MNNHFNIDKTWDNLNKRVPISPSPFLPFSLSLPSSLCASAPLRLCVKTFLFVILLSAGFSTQAQTTTAPKTLPAEMIEFLAGNWSGEGEFSNGRKIAADLSFTPELDNYWLLYRHTDQAPGRYKALGMWGFERETSKFIMLVEDNFGGMRRFESDGWTNGKIVFQKNVPATPANFPERFTFERQTADTLKMTYEASRDGQNWKLGDYLIFTRSTK